MKNKSVFNDFLRYVSLNVLGQMAYSCYTLADTFFVSAKLGSNGLAALNLAFPIFCLINGTGLMIGMGGGTKYSISKSRGNGEQANYFFTNAVRTMLITAILFVTMGVFCSETLAKVLGADDTVFSMTSTYLRVMLLFAPAFLTNNLLQCFVRNDGNPVLSMKAMIAGSLSNVILDYVFIFPLDLGIFGAILATGLAPVISIIVIFPYLFCRKNGFHIAKGTYVSTGIREIFSCGLPSFLTEATSGVIMFLFNFIILRISGNVGVAAFGVITVISLVVVAVYTGLSQGVQPIISRNYGAGKFTNVTYALKYAIITMLLISTLIYSGVYFGADTLAAIFNTEGNNVLQSYAVTGMKMYFTACPFIGLNIVLATYFVSTEKTRRAQTISLLRGFIILILMVFLLSAFWGMTGVWCAYPLTECLVALIGTTFYVAQKSQNKFS